MPLCTSPFPHASYTFLSFFSFTYILLFPPTLSLQARFSPCLHLYRPFTLSPYYFIPFLYLHLYNFDFFPFLSSSRSLPLLFSTFFIIQIPCIYLFLLFFLLFFFLLFFSFLSLLSFAPHIILLIFLLLHAWMGRRGTRVKGGGRRGRHKKMKEGDEETEGKNRENKE